MLLRVSKQPCRQEGDEAVCTSQGSRRWGGFWGQESPRKHRSPRKESPLLSEQTLSSQLRLLIRESLSHSRHKHSGR